MDKYLQQLLEDLKSATQHVAWPFPDDQSDAAAVGDWLTEQDEEKAAPRIQLEEWTGIQQTQFPPEKLLSDEQIDQLFKAITDMLVAHNYTATFIFAMPTRTKYELLRTHFKQEVIQRQWHMGFFELCFTNKAHPNCLMGDACQCAYFEEISENLVEKDSSLEEDEKN